MKKFFKNGWFIFGSIFFMFIGYFLLLGFNISEVIEYQVTEKGTFGDSFGFLTALFSALAFGAFIITLWQQQEELELTREELKKSADALSSQSENLQKQNFENTFFNLLTVHNNIRNEVNSRFSSSKQDLYDSAQDAAGGRLRRKEYPRRLQNYLTFYSYNTGKIGHYFRNIYQILKFIKNSDIENKKFYTNILRAQFSTTELQFLFFHCISKFGIEKFKPLLEEFEFLEPLFLDKNYLINEIELYDINVFGKNNETLKVIEKLKAEHNL